MSTMRYQDFDLAIELLASTPARYRTRLLASPAGQAGCEFDLPFAPLELDNLILRIGRPRRGIRRLDSPEMRAAQEFGGKLFAQAFQGQVQANFWRSLDLARQQGDGLRIRLRLIDAPDLADVPWEYLYDTAFHRFLAHSTYTPLVRYLDLPQTAPPLRVQPPLQILVMIASPRDQAALDVEAEWSKVQGALAELEQRGLVQVTRLEQATLAALQRQLRRQPYHVFHFIGHGGFDQQSQSGVLLLEDERGLSRLISCHHLGTLLHNHAALRLALLNACEGARTAMNDPFAGVAQQLVQQGLPAVIAMQFEITDPAAITLAQEFYAALADGYPVDAALTEARVALFTQGNDIEWGTPVLYLRAQDGLLFAVQTPARPTSTLIVADKPAEASVKVQPITLPAPEPLPNTPTDPPQTEPTPAPGDDTVAPAAAANPDVERPTPYISTPELIQAWDKARSAKEAKPILHAQTSASVTPPPPVRKRNWWLITGWLVGAAIALYLGAIGLDAYQTNQRHAQATATQAAALVTATAIAPHLQATATAIAPQLQATATAMVAKEAPTLQPLADKYGIKFIPVPGGMFQMGSPDGIGESDEHPQHEVTVKNFWIGQTEVTNRQYKFFIDAGGYSQDADWSAAGLKWRNDNKVTTPGCWQDEKWNQPDYPVVCLNWYEALAYTRWLAHETGLPVRLPSEAEWEWAARGADGRTYPWGDGWDGSRLNYCDKNCENSWKDNTVNDGFAKTAPVGSYPNGTTPEGVLDMAGNVWEWTSSLYKPYPYRADDGREDETVWASRVVRGGSWFNNSLNVRSADRFRNNPDGRFLDGDLRLVVSALQ